MNQQPRSIVCGQNDVVQIIYSGTRTFLTNGDTFRITNFIQKVKAAFMNRSSMNAEEAEKFLTDGFDCEYLQLGAHEWKKGKIKIKFEFHPDCIETDDTNPEQNHSDADLDDLRQLIHE